MQIRLAASTDIEPLSHLLNQFRHQLGQEKDFQACRMFLINRIAENDTIIFVACQDSNIIGFIQLYPSFSSVYLKPVWYLEDTFVVEEYRGRGVARSMMDKAKQLADGTEVMFVTRDHKHKEELLL
ncbi:GNAT family N-acetyltransferase [Shewanella maritima]|uniref:GNAT family N-acetyltransferase n=1 Tax=Shewanella maritima TaxID=2520507 RepID=UPI00373536E3